MSRQALVGIGLLLVIMSLVGCAAGLNAMKDSASIDGSVAGFWLGLWHGVIVPLTFIISLFSDNVTIYEVHNSGGWYYFGFLLGASIIRWWRRCSEISEENPVLLLAVLQRS